MSAPHLPEFRRPCQCGGYYVARCTWLRCASPVRVGPAFPDVAGFGGMDVDPVVG